MADISDWSGTASNNSVASPDGAATGWVGADVGPWARETMAAIQRWYEDPAWVNPTKDISPVGDKTLHRIDSKTMEIRPISGAFTSSQLSYFPAGRIIRFVVSGGTQKVYGVVSSSSLNGSYIRVVIGLLGQSSIPAVSFQNNGVEFYGAQESYSAAGNNVQVLGPTAISGAGTTSERNARFGSGSLQELPAGLIWFNSETEVIEVLADNPDNTGTQAWLSVAPLANAWTTKGAILNIEGKDPTLTSSPALYLIAQDVTPGENSYLQMGSRDASGNFQYNALFQANESNLLMWGPKTQTAGESTANLVLGGPGGAWEGKIAFRTQEHGVGGTYKDMTPGFIDAGTLNTLDSDTIIHRAVNIDNWHWRMSGAAHPAGDGTTTASFVQLAGNAGNRVELARFAFPQELIDELGIGNTYDLRFEFALSGFSGANGNTNPAVQSFTNAADQIQIWAYAGNNFGDPAQAITGFPTSGGYQFNRYTNEASNGLVDWSQNGNDTAIRITIAANTGIALAAQTDGPNNTFYVRINASVPALGSIPAMFTRVSFTPVKGTRYVAGDFQSDAQ